jgi:hypothetical protein
VTEQSNAINADLARKYASLDAECDDELIALQIEHMNRCKEVSERRRRHFKSAVAEGLPKDGWRLELKLLRLKRKAARQIANILEDEDRDVIESAEAVRNALGEQLIELPLGKWAVAKAEKAEKGEGAGKGAEVVPLKGRGRKKGAPVDMSAESKAEALEVGEDDEDLRSTRQKEREAKRKADNEARLAGIKPLDGDQPTAH